MAGEAIVVLDRDKDFVKEAKKREVQAQVVFAINMKNEYVANRRHFGKFRISSMNNRAFYTVLLFIFLNEMKGAEITSRFVDGLGRPLPKVSVEVKYPKQGPDGKLKDVEWLKMTSDEEGKIKVVYDETLLPTNETLWVSIKKPGYATLSTDKLKSEYVLKQQFEAADVHRIAQLSGEKLKTELRELLVGEVKVDPKAEYRNLHELVFFHEREFRSVLRDLVEDSHSGKTACSLLAFIGMPEDVRYIIKNAPLPKRKLYEDRWAYHVACSLLEPETKEEWNFLKSCATDVYYDRWVDAGAIRTLKLIGSAQSANLLKDAAKENPERKEFIAHALASTNTGPNWLKAADLEEAGKKVAQALRMGEWQLNTEPRYNKEKDMALIDCEFISRRDLLIETATFHKTGDKWKLRGVRETMQALLGSPPEKKRFVGVWQGFSESQIEFARLELKENGTGLLAVSFLPDSVPDKYVVTQWTLKDQLELAIKPAEPGAEPVTLQNVKLGMDVLQFVLRPIHGGDWNCRLKLYNEKTVQKRANAVKKALEELEKTP
jgi:hypothetical protein